MIGQGTIGQVNKFCCEDISLIENYKEAVTSEKRYCCHHKLGIEVAREELIEKGLYYSRPASELIFLEFGEHTKLHAQNLREETRKKRSEALKGRHFTNEHKQKLSDCRKGIHFTNEHKQKLSDCRKGEKNGNAKQCTINGITYGSLVDAHRALYPNMSYKTFHYKFRKGEL